MAATQLPATQVTVGGQPTISGYIVESWNTGGGALDQEDIKDADGAQYVRVVYENRMETFNGVLLATTGTGTEFPIGEACTVTGYTGFQVTQNDKETSKGVTRYTVAGEKVVFS